MSDTIFPLSALPIGGWGRVHDLCAEPAMKRRLMDLGLIQGTRVEALQRSPAGDPVAYRVRGAVIALRSEDASTVLLCHGDE